MKHLFKKTIFTGFSPNITWRDTRVACSYIFFPWKWPSITRGTAPKLAEKWLSTYMGGDETFVFDSGRSALFHALKAIGVGTGDEVLVQAYTCVVVSNAIRWTGATPIYVDITNEANMDITDLKNKITPKSKALIIQHTFGVPAQLNPILELAKQHRLFTIEDCAHALGSTYQGKKVGTFADIGMFSFGSDKIISCARGGALITRNHVIAQTLATTQAQLPSMSIKRVLQHLFHYMLFSLGRPLYSVYIGKAFFKLAKLLHMTNLLVDDEEKKGEQPAGFPTKMPNALAHILLNQLEDLELINEHRKMIAKLYQTEITNPKMIHAPGLSSTEAVPLRYLIKTNQVEQLLEAAKHQQIILGFWYDAVIAPAPIPQSVSLYQQGSCTKAEQLATQSVNLPTDRHITVADARRIIRMINDYEEKK